VRQKRLLRLKLVSRPKTVENAVGAESGNRIYVYCTPPALFGNNERKLVMESRKETDEVNKKHNKWLIAFRLNTLTHYTVWGADSTDNYNDKLWVDDCQRIILFRDPSKLIHAIVAKTFPTFDTENLVNWATAHRLYEFSDGNDALFNLDDLLRQAGVIKYDNLHKVDPKVGLDFVNFINLFGDYASQTNEDSLLKIWRNSSVHSFWEFMYTAHFWTIPSEEREERQEALLSDYEADQCKKVVQEMIDTFVNRFLLISPAK
jgi:hypothetical protein